ncbi:aspartate--tRNA ligase [Candidatus Woesearchaeota archaeon]|nr:aspartate--tRNA ligase [Candidatus Woesearchaeota archaeon]
MLRTHTCGELNQKNIGKKAILCGWAQSRRDHGGIIFIDLRDRYGLTQAVFDPSHNREVHKKAESLGREFVLKVEGKIRKRPEGMRNPDLKTGDIELLADHLEILNESETPPIEIEDRVVASEETRLKYRYLDLRRPIMQSRLAFRHTVTESAREYLSKNGFIEIETPILIRSTPEGARDYVVPSRIHARKFYALPQSPQIYKQILMIAGMDRYFQIARCLRDEDLRADRQPEHTQIDLEMSFVEQEDVMNLVEGMYKHIFKKVLRVDLEEFPRLTHDQSMDLYGTDKPDLRFGLMLTNVTDICKRSDFNVFKDAESIKCINFEKEISRNEIDQLIEWSKTQGAKGLAWMKVTEGGLESSITKYFTEEIQHEIISKTKAKRGFLFFIADKKAKTNEILSKLREKLASEHGMIKENQFRFCWVTDFPMFEWKEDENKWDFNHNPFCMPKKEHIEIMEKNPEKVKGELYDIVLNGIELGSGAIRINRPAIQEKAFGVVGIDRESAKKRFGFLLEAYRYGGPPHGGMGLGLDRLVALMQGFNDIREVIAFPKTKAAENPMDGSPSELEQRQLIELHLKFENKQPTAIERLKGILENNKAEYEIIEHKAAFTSQEAAEARGTELKQGARALILKSSGKYIMGVTSAQKEADLEKLKKITNSNDLRLATPKEVEAATGCSIGSVPPTGIIFGIETYVDKSLTENSMIAFNAGSHTRSIKMKLEDYVAIFKGKICDFSKG